MILLLILCKIRNNIYVNTHTHTQKANRINFKAKNIVSYPCANLSLFSDPESTN